MKACCIKNIPNYRPKAMYCMVCGTRFEKKLVPINVKAFANLPIKYCKYTANVGENSSSTTYYKITIEKARKVRDVIQVTVLYDTVLLSYGVGRLQVTTNTDVFYSFSRTIDYLSRLGTEEAIALHILNSAARGEEIKKEEYEKAKAEANVMLDFSKTYKENQC